MREEKNKPSFTNAQINELCDIVRRRVGIVIQKHQMSTLRDFLQHVQQQKTYKNGQDYLSRLQTQSINSLEYEELIKTITVGESYFFRDETQMSFLRDDWFPQLIDHKRKINSKIIRVWSAGCASGQEIYSVAILLKELIPDIDDWAIDLMGTDINVQAVSDAIHGKYKSWSFRETQEDIMHRYFQVIDAQYCLSDEIRKMGVFFYHNLVDNNYPSIVNGTSGLDLIVCRNVLLYFDVKIFHKILRRFAKCLIPGGILLMSPTDLKVDMIPELERNSKNKVIYYSCPTSEIAIAEPAATEDIVMDRVIETNIHKEFDKIQDLLAQENWKSALDHVNSAIDKIGGNAQLYLHQAMALANLGHLKDAMSSCKDALALDELKPENYLIQALILQELNQIKEAEKKARQCLFLDREFVDAHYYLGMLLLRQDKIKNGLKELHTALHILENKDLEQPLYLVPNMNYLEFSEILKREISVYDLKLEGSS